MGKYGHSRDPHAFYEPIANHEIDSRDLRGGEALNDFAGNLRNNVELKRESGTAGPVLELKSLIRGHRMGSNSAENPKKIRRFSR